MMPRPVGCAGCGGAVLDQLSVCYRRPGRIVNAAGGYAYGSASLRTCGSPACGAAAMLAVIEEIIADLATVGRLVAREDIEIMRVGHLEDFTYHVIDSGEPE